MILFNKIIGQINFFFSMFSKYKQMVVGLELAFESQQKNFWDQFKNQIKYLISKVFINTPTVLPNQSLGIYLNQHSLILVHLVKEPASKAILKSHSIVPVEISDLNLQKPEDKIQVEQAITAYINSNNLSGIGGTYVLAPTQYVISLVELSDQPNFTRDKVIFWSVKDYINYSIDDAILDSFDIPVNRSQDNMKLAYAVGMRSKLSQDLGELLHKCGVYLKSIDINELCIRNVIGLDPNLAQQACLVLKIGDDYSNIFLFKDNCLFISRNTKLDIKQLDDFDPLNHNSSQLMGIAESLLLELQRSLDYANNMFRGLNFSKIGILTGCLNLNAVITWLAQQSGLAVTKIDLTQVISFKDNLTPLNHPDWVLAVGGALRNFKFEELTDVTTNKSI